MEEKNALSLEGCARREYGMCHRVCMLCATFAVMSGSEGAGLRKGDRRRIGHRGKEKGTRRLDAEND